MRVITTLMALIFASHAMAHPGHITEVAGHDHWIAIGLIGVAGLAALLGRRTGEKRQPDEEEAPDSDAEPA